MSSRCPWAAQNPAEGQGLGKHSLSPAIAMTQAQGKSTSPAARSEQGRKLWLRVMFPSPGPVLGQRDVAARGAGLAPAGQECFTCAVENRDGVFAFEFPHKWSFMSSRHDAHLHHFFHYVLCNTALAGGLHASLGSRLCCWVLPGLNLLCWPLWLKCQPPSQGWSLSLFLMLLRLHCCNWICPFGHA